MEDLKNKVVIVTGACGGIGSAIAEKFAKAGAAMGLCDINREKLEQTAEKCRGEQVQVYSASTDVSKEDEVREFCDAVSQSLGTIDCLINTVGIVDCQGDIEELSLATWERALGTNLTSAFLMAKYSLPHMKKQDRGGHCEHRVGFGTGQPGEGDGLLRFESRVDLAHQEPGDRPGAPWYSCQFDCTGFRGYPAVAQRAT